MSRRIDTGTSPVSENDLPLHLGKPKREDYLGRLAKYIPAEIVALYIATSDMVPKLPDGKQQYGALWIVFSLCFFLVPVYLAFATSRKNKPILWSQVALSSIAFPVWAFALGGPFNYFAWYQGWIASITLAFVTVIFGFYEPRPGS
jgi:hypothetical protein